MNIDIANPMYDVVFKFMMEDEEAAKSFLSAIIDEKIVELECLAQEDLVWIASRKKNEEKDLFSPICRYNFSAKIFVPDDEVKTVLIDLRKAKSTANVAQVQYYIGMSNFYPIRDFNCLADDRHRILLLEHDIHMKEYPILRIDHQLEDLLNHTILNVEPRDEFLLSMYFRLWIVQLKQIKQRRNGLETLLNIMFDEKNCTRNRHILTVEENDFAPEYRSIANRLRIAGESQEIQTKMDEEDRYSEGLLTEEL
jgi:hypothetical protein